MDWSKGYSARYILTVVDPSSWADVQEIEFLEGSIDKDFNSDSIESASVTVDNVIAERESWIRIYLQTTQQGASFRCPLFTGLTSSPEKTINGTKTEWKIDCASVLKPCDDVLVPLGFYVPAGSNANKVKELLSVSPAPIEIEGNSPVLTSAIVAESGESNLTMAKKILNALGWQLRLHGDGKITICARPDDVKVRFNSEDNDSIEPKVTDKYDWYSCPNVYMATSEDGTAIARDDDPDSPLSTVSRGREIWQEESSVTLSANESIASYAIRKLKEAQSPARTLKYDRRYYDDVTVGDLIELDYPVQRISGKYRINTQSIDLGYGCKTTEGVTKE